MTRMIFGREALLAVCAAAPETAAEETAAAGIALSHSRRVGFPDVTLASVRKVYHVLE
jgi:hypothetical protein